MILHSVHTMQFWYKVVQIKLKKHTQKTKYNINKNSTKVPEGKQTHNEQKNILYIIPVRKIS